MVQTDWNVYRSVHLFRLKGQNLRNLSQQTEQFVFCIFDYFFQNCLIDYSKREFETFEQETNIFCGLFLVFVTE